MNDNKCDKKECQYCRDGECLDKQTLKHPDKQTGCIYYSGRNVTDG
ncbi:hypothetical protein LNN31_13675 [Acetobacterium wieringae]|uniref:DUF1540 domain-containing protein n=1 Tax=Acetobacterium wieringae TaxID=52694 RepID=A0ABY6HE52_9FIRM|nr:hypothetical protein [Acetobacterium wieringae]UYO61826.1 hypothetical protein LNN31_13675 [Acetobacterium wieringae]